MNTLAQELLRTRSLADLARTHAVYATASANRRKVTLNYDMVEARDGDPVARQCRGLILARLDHEEFTPAMLDGDEPVGDTIVVARPFDRFLNHGQGGADAAALLGQRGTRVFEKADGTLCIVYHDDYRGQWHVATRSVPEADRPIDGFKTYTFATLFEKALHEHLNLTLERLGTELDRDVTYLFELVSPYNRVVVKYPRCEVYLLGARNRLTGYALCPVTKATIDNLLVPVVRHHPCGTFAELMGLAVDRSALESEGVVVRSGEVDESGAFVRVKVKNPEWVLLSATKASAVGSPRRLLELVLLGKIDDVLPMLPPDTAAVAEEFRASFPALCHRVDADYTRLTAAHKDRKAFAVAVQAERLWMPPLIERFLGKCVSMRDFVEGKRDTTGGWPDVFLDTLIRQMGDTRPR